MYLTELDIRSIDDLFMVLFKEELFKHQGLADWYEMQQIESLDQRFNEVCNLFWGRMGTLEDRISKLENPINPKIEEILRSNPRELLWEASKSVYEISKQEGQRFAYDIIDRLLPNGYIPKLTVPIEGKTEGGQSAPLAELCKAINDHVAIIGNGGTGKTTFLHYLIEQSFAQSPEKFSDLLVYIFIELNRCPTDIVHWHNDPSRKTKFITRYIGALLENHVSLDTVDDRILEYVEKELQKRPDGGKPQYVLLLDGFNEVKIDEGYSIRSLLSNEISTIKKYDNVRIITTSRETQAAYYAAGFTNIRVTGLNDSVIIEHLRGCGKQEYFIAEVMNNKHLVECLRTPLYLCMFASSGENTLLPETQGEILYFFFHRNSSFYNIRKRAVETRTNPLNELQTQLVLDFILPYIGACFESEDIFSVNAGNFGHMILKSVEAVRELFLDAGSNPFVDFHYSKNCLQSTLDSLVEGDIVKTTDVIKCVFDYLGIPDDIVTNGNFANDLTSWSTWTENGSTYSVDAGEQCFVANIPTTLPNPWSAQLYQVIDVPAAGSYRVTFKAKASMNREIRLALEKDGQSPLMDETMSVSADWTNYSYDFTVSSAASGVKLVFMLGNVGTTENMAHTISIDDISLYKVS